MIRAGRILLVATVLILPLLPLPALLLHSPGPDEPPTLRPVHDYHASKWALLAVGLTAVSAAWLLSNAVKSRREATDWLVPTGAWPLAALVLLGFASALWAQVPSAALTAAIRMAVLAGVYVVCVQLAPKREEGRRLAAALAAAAVVVAIYGIAQRTGVDFSSLPWAANRKPVSTLGNTNFASELLVVTIPMLLAIGLRARTAVAEALAFGGCALTLLHLALTETRAGWISLGAGLVAGAILLRRHGSAIPSPGRKLGWIGGIAGAVAIALMLPALDGGSVARKAGSLVRADHPSTRVRVHLWSSTLEMIRDHPVLGVGLGNFAVQYPRYRRPAEVELSGYLSSVETAHNDPLQLASEAGLPGVTLWAAFLVALGLVALRRRVDGRGEKPDSESEPDPILRAAAAAAVAGFVVNGAFRSPLFNPAAAVSFAVAAGILAAPSAKRRVTASRVALAAPVLLLIPLAAVWIETGHLRADRAIRTAIGWEEAGAAAAAASRNPAELDAGLGRAEEALEHGLAVSPRSFEVAFRTGQVRSRRARLIEQRQGAEAAQSKVESARAAFTKALDSRPFDAHTIVNRAIETARLGLLDEATAELDRAENIAPHDPIVQFNRGRMMVIRGREGEAALAFERAHGLRPRHLRTLEELVGCYERLIAANPEARTYLPLLDNTGARMAVARALDSIDGERISEAEEGVARAVARTHNATPELLRLHAALLARSGETDAAEEAVRSARDAGWRPDSWLARDLTYRRLATSADVSRTLAPGAPNE